MVLLETIWLHGSETSSSWLSSLFTTIRQTRITQVWMKRRVAIYSQTEFRLLVGSATIQPRQNKELRRFISMWGGDEHQRCWQIHPAASVHFSSPPPPPSQQRENPLPGWSLDLKACRLSPSVRHSLGENRSVSDMKHPSAWCRESLLSHGWILRRRSSGRANQAPHPRYRCENMRKYFRAIQAQRSHFLFVFGSTKMSFWWALSH